MNWTADKILDLAKRMETKPKGFRISAETAPLVIEALQTYAREHCCEPLRDKGFGIDVWDATGNSIIEHVAQSTNLEAARAAYHATVADRPGSRVTMRHGIRVVMTTEQTR